MRMAFAFLCVALMTGCGRDKKSGLCADDGDPKGPLCVLQVASAAEFEVLSLEMRYLPTSDWISMYLAPARDDPELLPIVFQNSNRYAEHVDSLRASFPEHFPDLNEQSYLDMIIARETRRYYSGKLVHIQDPVEGELYGFTVYTAASSPELLGEEEARWLQSKMAEVFLAGTIAYTFDPYDTMTPAKAGGWSDPGFPIYFY